MNEHDGINFYSLLPDDFPEGFDLRAIFLGSVDDNILEFFVSLEALRLGVQKYRKDYEIDEASLEALYEVASEILPETTEESLRALRELPVPTELDGFSFWICDACSAAKPPHGGIMLDGAPFIHVEVQHLMGGLDLIMRLRHEDNSEFSQDLRAGLFLQMLASDLPLDELEREAQIHTAIGANLVGTDPPPGALAH